MRIKSPRYLRRHRREWGLTQDEIARLLSYRSGPHISRLEQDMRKPTLRVLFGYEVIFGHSPRTLFPDVFLNVEEAVMRQAIAMHERLKGRNDARSKRKVQLIAEMFARAAGSNPLQNES
jgi:transcriptional regulator with XRE-family HTH domain